MTCCCGHTKKQHDNYVSTIKYAWGEGCKVCNKCGKEPRFVKGHYENDVWVEAKRKSDGCQCKFLNQLCRCEWYNKHKKNCDYCDEDYKFECKGLYKIAGEWFKIVNGLQVKA